jgi:hypothetical protein
VQRTRARASEASKPDNQQYPSDKDWTNSGEQVEARLNAKLPIILLTDDHGQTKNGLDKLGTPAVL